MKEKNGTFLSSNGESNITYRICLPDSNAKGIIQIAHGMCEYFDRYEETIKYFTDNGFVVCGNDHMGHGKGVAKEDLGYFGSDTWRCLADDLKQLNAIVRKSYRSLPYILIGHSMGSFVVRDYITRYADSIDGCVICGTSGSNKAVGAGLTLCSLIEKLKGPKYRSKLIKDISFSGYNKLFKREKDPLSWLCRDEAVRKAYDEDDYCGFTFTVSAYKNLFNLLKCVSDEDWAKKVPLWLPVYVISGRDDPVGNYGKGVDEVFDRLNGCELNFLKYKLYDDCRHELFNEKNRLEVCDDVREFCESVIEGVLEARGYGVY